MNQRANYDQQRSKLEEEIRRRQAELERHKPNILVVGRAGVGKSSLINAIFGAKVAETGAGRPITQSYAIYELPLINLLDSRGWEGGSDGEARFKADTKGLLDQRRTANPDDHIHIVWYLIAGVDERYQDFDERLVRESFGGIPVLFVLTKCDVVKPDNLDKVELEIKASAARMSQQATRGAPAPVVVGVVRTSAEPLPVFQREPWGIVEVVEKTREQLPTLFQNAFDAAQAVDFSIKAKKARAVVLAAAAAAAGIGAVPIPFSDSALLTPMQIGMVAQIGLIYGFGSDPGTLTALIGGSIAPLAAESVGISLASNLIKMVPGAGSVVGGLISGGVAATVTATIGFAFQTAFHQLALMKAKGQQPVTVEAAAAFLKQALPQAMEAVKQRGIKNILSGGADS